MKALNLAAAIAAILFVSTGVRADGLTDARVGVSGGSGSSGDCTSYQLTADGTGAITTGTECKVTGVNATSITIAVPVGQTGSGPGLQIYTPLTTNVTSQVPVNVLDQLFGMTLGNDIENFLAEFNWTDSCPPATIGNAGGVSSYECTLSAPAMPTDQKSLFFLGLLTKFGVINDGDCDNDDFVFYIPVGCDVKFTTGAIGNLPGDTPDQLLSANAQVDAVTNGSSDFVPFPEPGVLSLLLMGFAGLPFIRRRMAR